MHFAKRREARADTEPMIPQMYGQNVGSRHLQVLMQGLELFTTEKGVPDALHKLHEYRKQAKTQLGVNGFVEALQAAILPQDASSEKFASLDILTLSKLFDDMGGFPANVPESEDKVVATKAFAELAEVPEGARVLSFFKVFLMCQIHGQCLVIGC